jgi:hypothetical protein
MPGQVNQDGTVQVSPPKISAFSPQASASDPAPMPPPSPQAQAAAAHPGFAEAILQMLSQLSSALNPKVSRTVRPVEQGVQQGLGNDIAGQ